MIAVEVDMDQFTLPDKMAQFISPKGQEDMLRAVSLSMLPVVHDRIHVDGKAADGSGIGTYSPSYLKYTRPKFNRSKDPKVILSLTRQMESDFSVVADSGKYGLGFKNSLNFDKATWLEGTYKKRIYALTTQERDLAITAAQEYTNGIL